MSRHIYASHKDYFHIELNQRVLCALINSHMHKFEHFPIDLPDQERAIAIIQIEERMDQWLKTGIWRDALE